MIFIEDCAYTSGVQEKQYRDNIQPINEISIWSNGLGMDWITSHFPDGNYSKIQWTGHKGAHIRGIEDFVFIQTFNNSAPISRKPNSQELYNFALIALSKQPETEIVRQMAQDVVLSLQNEVADLKEKQIDISDLLSDISLNTK